jgi:hypothetical protein
MPQLHALAHQDIDQLRMRMTQARDSNAGREIEIPPTIGAMQPRAVTLGEADIRAGEAGKQMV